MPFGKARDSTRSSAISGPVSGNSRVPWPTITGTLLPVSKRVVRTCVKPSKPADALFERARINGLNSIDRSWRAGHLARVIGEVAESEIVLDEQGYNLF